MEKRPVLRVRVIAPDECIDPLCDVLEAALDDNYEVLERTFPRRIIGDDENKKVYISVRDLRP